MYGNFHTKRRSGENLPVFFLFLDPPPSYSVSHFTYFILFSFEKRRQNKRCLVVYRISHASLRNLNTTYYYEFPYYLFIRALSRTHLDVWSRIVKKVFQKKFFYDRQEKFRNFLPFPSVFDPPPT